MRATGTLLGLLLLAVAAVTAQSQEKPREVKTEHGLAVFKLGEKFATDDHAGKTMDSFCSFLGSRHPEALFVRRGVRNKPEDALALLKSDTAKVSVAIVSPGFYLAHRKALKLTVLAEAGRDGTDGEEYVLLGLQAAAEYPAGARVATSLSADADWLNKAVLPAPAGKAAVQWVPYDNLFDAGYAMLDGEKDAPQYVLVDRVTLKAMQADPDLKELKAGLKSELLPQDLVVEVDSRLGNLREALKQTLATLDKSDEGKAQGKALQSPVFKAPAAERLAKVEKLIGDQ